MGKKTPAAIFLSFPDHRDITKAGFADNFFREDIQPGLSARKKFVGKLTPVFLLS
jgi:hypothetical protein